MSDVQYIRFCHASVGQRASRIVAGVVSDMVALYSARIRGVTPELV